MIVVDTSGLLAAMDAAERHHAATAAALRKVRGPYILSPFVLAELDYLVRRHVSAEAAQRLLGEVADGAQRYGVRDVMTLDERHFRAVRGPGDPPFQLLPADA